MVDPFGIVLSTGISWVTTKLLDVIADCLKCECTHPRTIQNQSINEISCPSCSNSLPQYINICDSTFDPESREVGVAGISDVHFLQPQYSFDVRVNPKIWAVGFEGRNLLATLEVGNYSTGYVVYKDHKVLEPTGYHSVWDDLHIDVSHLRFQKNSDIYIIDLKVLTESGDLVAYKRHLLDVRDFPLASMFRKYYR